MKSTKNLYHKYFYSFNFILIEIIILSFQINILGWTKMCELLVSCFVTVSMVRFSLVLGTSLNWIDFVGFISYVSWIEQTDRLKSTWVGSLVSFFNLGMGLNYSFKVWAYIIF